MENNFSIKCIYDSIILQKDNRTIQINQASDHDICFRTKESEVSIELNFSSREFAEWQTYKVFASLMKSIIGRYILSGDAQNEYNGLPEDFIDLDNKIITWYSDSSLDNILTLQYSQNIIRISLTKSKNAKEHQGNSVRIRTSSSSYGYYYQEFEDFFRNLCHLEQQCRLEQQLNGSKTEEAAYQKKL